MKIYDIIELFDNSYGLLYSRHRSILTRSLFLTCSLSVAFAFFSVLPITVRRASHSVEGFSSISVALFPPLFYAGVFVNLYVLLSLIRSILFHLFMIYRFRSRLNERALICSHKNMTFDFDV